MNFSNILIKKEKNIEKSHKKIKNESDFVKIKELGSGGFGKVFKIRSLLDNNIYAMKQIFKNKNLPKYNYREINMFKRLKDQNVIKYYEYFEDENNVNLIIEYMENGSLDEFYYKHLKEFKIKLPDEIIWRHILQAISGLAYIHSKNIMHRDIKPKNLLIDDNLKLKIGDFGISAIFDDFDNKNKTIIQIGDYTAPEVKSKIYDEKIDIYSMGQVFNELNNYISKKNDVLSNIIIRMINNNPKERPSSKDVYEIIIKEFYEKYLKVSSIDSLIRCLYTFNPMTSFFLNSKNFNIIKEITKSYINCLKAFTDPNINSWTKAMKDLRFELEKENPLLEQYQEIDPIIFYAFLFEGLHTELNNKNIEKNKENQHIIDIGIFTQNDKVETKLNFLNNFVIKLNSYISNNFMGLIKIIRICKECQFKTYEFKSYFMFTMDLINISEGNNKKKITLEECFNYLKNKESLTNCMCRNCIKITKHSVNKFIYSAPFFLVINIKNDSQNKIELYLNESLDIKEHVEILNLPTKFKLTGILKKDKKEEIYFSNINIEKNWYYCKDKKLKEINFKNIKETNEEIIMLFFQSV